MPAYKAHSVRKNFRLTASEAACLRRHAAAADVTESDYVRRLITDPSHVFTGDAETLRALYRELKRQGVNLNQIAYAVNSGRARTLDTDSLESLREANENALHSLLPLLDDMRGGGHADR